jgi:hypothetical protein
MLYEKVFETTIDILDVMNFCCDTARHTMTELQNKFVGKCFKGAFIVAIVRVLQSSACHMMSTNLSGDGRIDVRFLATVAVLGSGDILVGVQVVRIPPLFIGDYQGRNEAALVRASVTVSPSKTLETVAVGQKIAVYVLHALHKPMQPIMTVYGTMLTCDVSFTSHRLRGALEAKARVELAPLYNAILQELTLRASIDRAQLWFFERLLYSYRPSSGKDQKIAAWEGKDVPVWEGPSGVGAPGGVNVLSIVRRVIAGENVPVDGVWARPLNVYRSSPMVTHTVDDNIVADEGNARATFVKFLKNILDYLMAIREMTEVYTPEDHLSHRNIWAAMTSVQAAAP